MNNPLVSIIIPVFNAENTLTKCMKSILDQSYQNIQVILINDGSTDNSAAICDKYSSKDKRVTSIHTLNNGVSHARNCGMSVAEGDYICFVDSDDWIKKDYVEKLVKYIIEHNVDMVMCGWKENETVFSECPKEKEYLILSNLEVLSKFFSEFSGHCFALWNKMFKKEYVDRFDESISYLEDGIFVCRYLKKLRTYV